MPNAAPKARLAQCLAQGSPNPLPNPHAAIATMNGTIAIKCGTNHHKLGFGRSLGSSGLVTLVTIIANILILCYTVSIGFRRDEKWQQC